MGAEGPDDPIPVDVMARGQERARGEVDRDDEVVGSEWPRDSASAHLEQGDQLGHALVRDRVGHVEPSGLIGGGVAG
jgi:hypothetical protein